MAFSLIVSTSAGSTNTNAITTSAIDTTGANLIVLVTTAYNAINNPGAPSDNKSNTPHAGQSAFTLTNFLLSIDYFYNPTVGSGHTFSMGANSTFPTILVGAFSGATTADPLDGAATNQNNGSGISESSVNTGSVTPSEANELVVAAAMLVDATGSVASIDLSFILQEQQVADGVNHQGGAFAYQIQTTATARNPTFTFSGVSRCCACIASFKAATAGGMRTHFLPVLGAG